MTPPDSPQIAIASLMNALDALRRLAGGSCHAPLGSLHIQVPDTAVLTRTQPPARLDALSAHARLQACTLTDRAQAAADTLAHSFAAVPALAFWTPDTRIALRRNGPYDLLRLETDGTAWWEETTSDIAGENLDEILTLLHTLPIARHAPRRRFKVGEFHVTAPDPATALFIGTALTEFRSLRSGDTRAFDVATPVLELHADTDTVPRATALLERARASVDTEPSR